MKKSNRRTPEENYWESMADSMVALLLCILLVMLLLMLYLVRINDNDMQDDQLGYSYEKYEDPDDGGGNHSYGQRDDEDGDAYENADNGGGNGGGGGGNAGEADDRFPYEDPDLGAGEGTGAERAAVFVQVIDGETERTIKKEGITFELYGRNAALQMLSTYYPKKITYKQYKTDGNGVFYLPERVIPEIYYLHCLTAIPGYDTGENVYFEIDQPYDWEDPFVVNVRLYPSKNAIEVHLQDGSNGTPVSGASFQVIAAENIVTADGTVRYRENSVVDNITVGSDGVGRSKDLYLGNYILRQVTVPEYYGKMEQDEAVTLRARTAAKQQEVVDIYAEKTTMEVTAVDGLYDTLVLPGMSFTLRTGDGTVLGRYTTDERGRFTVSGLKKNTAYSFRQESTLDGYQKVMEDLSFRVTGDGYIDGAVNGAMKVKNRIIRVSVGVYDKLFRNLVSDVNLALVDRDGTVIRNWSSTGIEQVIEGLPAGEYQLVMGGDRDSARTILVEDQTELQEVRLERWTTVDIAVLISVCVVGMGLVALLVWLLKNKKQKQKGSDLSDG